MVFLFHNEPGMRIMGMRLSFRNPVRSKAVGIFGALLDHLSFRPERLRTRWDNAVALAGVDGGFSFGGKEKAFNVECIRLRA